MTSITKTGTVYVVDDDDIVRQALYRALADRGYHVRLFESAESFLSVFASDEIACLITEVHLPGMTGLELQTRLIQHPPPIPLAFITDFGDIPVAVQAMKKGAIDFLQKPVTPKQLTQLVEHLLKQARHSFAKYTAAQQMDALMARLTPRENDVLTRIVAGRLNKQIAHEMNITIKTVESHRAHLMKKCNANSVADLIKLVIRPTAPLWVDAEHG